jgi:hypothetical protein
LDKRPHELESHSACMAAALHRRGMSFGAIMARRRPDVPAEVWLAFEAAGRHWFFRYGQLWVGASPSISAARHINAGTAAVTTSKRATKALLEGAGLPVAPGKAFAAADRAGALAWFEAAGGEVCVKPDGGTQGQALTTHVGGRRSFETAFDRVAAGFSTVMVERMLEGEVIRVLCLDGRSVATRLDRRPGVLGDGSASVNALVAAKNAVRARRALPGHVPLSLDDTALFYLARQGLDADAVPGPQQRVWLSGSSHPNQGGDVVSGPPGLHPSHIRLAEEACRALPGLRVAGYDLLVADRRTPGNAWVLEVNSSPGLTFFHHPWRGPAQDVAGALLDWILAGE